MKSYIKKIKKYVPHEVQNLVKRAIWIYRKHNKEYRAVCALVEKNKRFYNIHQGKRCFIIGNGPSINNQNLTLLENEIVFTVNKFFKHPQVRKIRPTYHVFADPLFYDTQWREINIDAIASISKAEIETEVFFPYKGYDYAIENGFDKMVNLNFFASWLSFETGKIAFDYTKLITGYNTVVQYAIALAVYMGCSDIFLLGCDNTGILGFCESKMNTNDDQAHFYIESEAEKKKRSSRVTMFSFKIKQKYSKDMKFCTHF